MLTRGAVYGLRVVGASGLVSTRAIGRALMNLAFLASLQSLPHGDHLLAGRVNFVVVPKVSHEIELVENANAHGRIEHEIVVAIWQYRPHEYEIRIDIATRAIASRRTTL